MRRRDMGIEREQVRRGEGEREGERGMREIVRECERDRERIKG